MAEITDRELLAICNLSNLRMEFAKIKYKETDTENEVNHTIYSLLEKECNGLKIREEWEKKWHEENPLEVEADEAKRDYAAEKYKEKFKEERANRFMKEDNEDEEYGSFYSIEDGKRKEYEYWHKVELQKSAPILMEYFDRYNLSPDKENHEGKFLEEWEIIYGGDFYQILLDYAFKTHQEYSKESEKCKDIEEYIKKMKIPNRKDLLSKEEKIEFLNLTWDFLTTLLGVDNFITTSGVSTVASTGATIKMAAENAGKVELMKIAYEMITKDKIADEKITEEEWEKISNTFKGKTLKLKGEINFKVVDFRIVILRKKETNKYVVSFYNSKDNMVIESFEKGALNLDLVLVNEVIENEIRKISKNENAEIIYTGYEYGALMAFSSHSMFNSLFKQNPNVGEIRTFSKVFIGEKKYNFKNPFNIMNIAKSKGIFDFEKMINFDIEKLSSIQPGSVTYTKNIFESLGNVFSMCLVNIGGTNGICLVTIIAIKGVSTALASSSLMSTLITSLHPVVYLAIFLGYFAHSEYYRAKIESIKEKMLEYKVITKEGEYTIVNKEFKNYTSVFEINQRIKEKNIVKSVSSRNKNRNRPILNNKEEKAKLNITEEKLNFKEGTKLYPITLNKLGNRTVYVPREVAIIFCLSYYEKVSPYIEPNIIELFQEGFRYRLKLDSENNFYSIEKVWEERSQREVHKIFRNPEFEIESLFDYGLFLMTIIQDKYDFKNKIFENSEFIYMKQLELTEEEKKILNSIEKQIEKDRISFEEEALLKDKYIFESSIDNSLNNEQTAEVENLNKEIYVGEGGFNAERRQYEKFVPRYDKIPYYTELTKIDKYEVVSVDYDDNFKYRENTNAEEINNYKITKTKIKPLIKIDNFKKEKFIYAKKSPTLTKKLDEIEYINYFNDISFITKIAYNEYIYFPYVELGKNGKITENIREDYIGSILRSSFRNKLKYESLNEEQKDIFVENTPLTGEEGNKNERLNKYFIQKIERYGKELGYPEHYNSVMKLLEANPKLVENYYTLQESNKRIPTKNLKIGILNGNEYALDKIGFIYNEDDIYGRAIKFIYNYGSGDKLEEISTYGVCEGATLWCSVGSASGNLLVTSQNFEYTDGFLDATKDDCKAIVNITPFGSCGHNKKKPCINYISLEQWTDTSSGTETNNKKAILSTGTINCKEKGKISIINPNCKLHNN